MAKRDEIWDRGNLRETRGEGGESWGRFFAIFPFYF